MTTKIPVELSSTPGIVDGSNATAITISSAEKVTFAKDIEIQGDSVSGSEGGHITLRAASGGSKEFGIDVDSSNNLRFITEDDGTGDNGAAHLYLTNTGNVGIGTASPDNKLHVYAGDSGHSWSFDSGDYFIIENSDTVAMNMVSTSTNQNLILFSDNGTRGVGLIGYNHSENSLRFHTSNAEKMRIDSSGNVGIRNSSPASLNSLGGSQFVIGDGTGTQNLYIYSATNGSGHIAFADSNANGSSAQYAGLIQYNHTENRMRFYTNATERMRIDSSGNVAISAGNLYVSGEGTSFSAGSHNGNLLDDNGQSISSRAATNNQTHKSFYNPNGAVGSITTNGSATAFNTSSDYRLKENVVTDWDGTTLLKQLKPSKFNFKADTDTTIQGFLAHEVSGIVPQAVSGEKDAVYTAEEAAENITAVEGQPNYQSIDHSKLVPLLVKTIQELEARITTLEGE